MDTPPLVCISCSRLRLSICPNDASHNALRLYYLTSMPTLQNPSACRATPCSSIWIHPPAGRVSERVSARGPWAIGCSLFINLAFVPPRLVLPSSSPHSPSSPYAPSSPSLFVALKRSLPHPGPPNPFLSFLPPLFLPSRLQLFLPVPVTKSQTVCVRGRGRAFRARRVRRRSLPRITYLVLYLPMAPSLSDSVHLSHPHSILLVSQISCLPSL